VKTTPKHHTSDTAKHGKTGYQHEVLELTMPASPELTGRKIPVEIATQDK
jgi:hypothetical protein